MTTIKIKNLSNGAIAGLKVDEFWYDKDGRSSHRLSALPVAQAAPAGRSDRRRAAGPTNPKMDRNQHKFEHANGTIKTRLLPKL